MTLETEVSMTLLEPIFEHFSIWGTSGTLGVTDSSVLVEARAILDEVIRNIDHAANRFRGESELLHVNARSGSGPIPVSAIFLDLLGQSAWAYEETQHACDPTIIDALIANGYDRDFDELVDLGSGPHAMPSPGMDGIEIDYSNSTITLPPGVHLDFGATAKARASDVAAERIAQECGVGCLVSLGGDMRVEGPSPADGWMVGITQSTRPGSADVVDDVVALHSGALASSSSTVRQWKANGEQRHHIIDPSTGMSAQTPFSLVSVVAPTCVEANAFATASIIWGDDAFFALPQRGLPLRALLFDGSVERGGGWPEPFNELSS